jgi:hypothetical protein
MAQTKSTTRKRSTSRTSSGARNGNNRDGTKRPSPGNRTSTRGRAGQRSGGTRSGGTTSSRSRNGTSPVKAVKGSIGSGAEAVGNAVGTAAKKGKTPLIAGGAALTGLAGGLAVATASRRSRRKVLGLPIPKPGSVTRTTGNLASTAEQIGSLGRNAGQLATEMRRMREQGESAQRRSPIEVVLDGLTARRAKDLS